MGDRATFVIEQSDESVLYVYGHWAGEGMMANLANALTAASSRIFMDDEVYAARIIISNLIGDDWRSETGWGISTYFCDSEHSVPVVNLKSQTVRLIPYSAYSGKFDINDEPKFTMSIDNFVNKFAKALTTVQVSTTILLTTTKVGSKMSKVIVRTEKWNTKQGQVIKAVVRDEKGIFIGATNQTQVIPQTLVIVGK